MTQGIWTPGGPFDRQPQGPVEIDWSNPIARGLQIAALPAGGGFVDVAGNAPWTSVNAPTTDVTTKGRAFKTVGGSSQYGYFPCDVKNAPLTILHTSTLDSSSISAVFSLGTAAGTERLVLFYGATAGQYTISPIPNAGGSDTSFTTGIGDSHTSVLVLSADATPADLYLNGSKGSTGGNYWVPTGAITRFYLSARVNSTAGIFSSQRSNLSLVWSRALSDAEIASISANPWQLFRDDTSDLLIFDMGAGGGASPVSGDLPGGYGIMSSVSADLAGAYAILTTATADLAGAYGVVSAVQADLPGAYAVVSAVSADLSGAYAIDGPAGVVGADLAGAYAILAAVQADHAGAYAVLNPVAADLAGAYALAAAVSADLAGAYGIAGAVSADLSGGYGVAGVVSSDFAGSHMILQAVAADLPGAYAMLQYAGADLPGAYGIGGTVGADLPGAYAVLGVVSSDLPGAYSIRTDTVEFGAIEIAEIAMVANPLFRRGTRAYPLRRNWRTFL